jgi:hypothetical protein
MSEVLEDFVAPYMDMVGDNEEVYRKLLCLAVLAWNAALWPREEGQAMIDDALGKALSQGSEEDWADARDVIAELMRRKREHFATNQRDILSFELTDTGEGFHLSVVSTL